MKGFIRLTDRRGCVMININPEHIVAVRDMRSDKVAASFPSWHWTTVDTLKCRYEVKETEEEIVKLITELQ